MERQTDLPKPKWLPKLGLNRRRRVGNVPTQDQQVPPQVPQLQQPSVDQVLKTQLNKLLIALAPRIEKLAVVFPDRHQQLLQAKRNAESDLKADRLNQAKAAVMQLAQDVGGLEQQAQQLEAEMKDRLKRLASSISYATKLASAASVPMPQPIGTGRNEVAQFASGGRFGDAIARIKTLEQDIGSFLRSLPPQTQLRAAMKPENMPTPKDVFGDEDRKRIAKATDRGIPKGHGEFKKILSAWSDVQKHPDQPDKVKQLETLVLEYLQTHPVEPKDEIAANKRQACLEILDKIRELAAFRLREQYGQLEKQGGGPQEQRDLHIKLLATGKGVKVPSSKGASDSFFLSDPTGRPVYIFKPMQGENEADGFPPGGGAVREVMLSRLNERLKQGIGLDFGVCPTTMIQLESSSFLTSSGGLKSQDVKRLGAVQDTAECDDDLMKYIGMEARQKSEEVSGEELKRRKASIRVDDVQKVAVLDFLTLNLDRNPGNLLFKKQDDGKVRLIPIDAGNSLPSRETFLKKSGGLFNMPQAPEQFLGQGNALMALEQAQQPFSEELVRMIDQLDPTVFRNQAQQEYEGLTKSHGELDNLIDPTTFDLMERSAAFLKHACRKLTPYEMMVAYSMFFRDVLDASPEKLVEVMDVVIVKAKQEAEGLKYEFEYAQRSKQIPLALAERVKSVDKSRFEQLKQQINQFAKQKNFKGACALLDDYQEAVERILLAATQDPQAAIRRFWEGCGAQGMSLDELLVAADKVEESPEEAVEGKRMSYRQHKEEYAKLSQLNLQPGCKFADLDRVLVAIDTLEARAAALLRELGQIR